MRTVGFLSIGRHVDLILNQLRNDRALRELSDDRNDNPVDPRTNANGVGAEKEKTEDQREYVEARLKQISEWERKISGFNKRRVK